MITLRQGSLAVELLDPHSAADSERQGSRYCWGGYIWQVSDAEAGPLCAGPEWPSPTPAAFNGQGLPESFRHREFGTAAPLTFENGQGFVLGGGELVRQADGNFILGQPCPWTVSVTAASAEFTTEQSAGGWRIRLRRTVELRGREVISTSRVLNLGGRAFPLHWFCHPFFALNAGRIEAALPGGWTLEPNPGFALTGSGHLTQSRIFAGVDDGQFAQLQFPAGARFQARISHPHLTGIEFSADFTPAMCPIWGNGNTWSIEPYLITTLEPKGDQSWTLRYLFGASK